MDLLSMILDRIKAAEKDTGDALISGTNIQSYEQYQRILGVREGLSRALTEIEGVLTEDDEDLNN
jgi:hypothetical protein